MERNKFPGYNLLSSGCEKAKKIFNLCFMTFEMTKLWMTTVMCVLVSLNEVVVIEVIRHTWEHGRILL